MPHLEVTGEVAAAELSIPGAVPHVVTAAETHDVHVARLVERLERLDGAVASVGAGHDDLRFRLVREDALHRLDELLAVST